MLNQPVSRRAWLAGLASGAGAVAAACSTGKPTEVTTEEGSVLQWEGDDLLVLVSGYAPTYAQGDSMHLTLLVNNQSTHLVDVRLRTKILGLGDQPVVQADPVQLTVKSDDAGSADQELVLGRNLDPGDYTLSVEVPPWKVEGRDTGKGVTLRTPIHLTAG